MLPSTIVVAVFAVAHAERLNTPSTFMLVGGVSARSEMCLMGLENVGASLSDCGAAVAELDGREIWSLSAGGALTSLASKKCLAVPSGAVAGARVALASCDGPDASAAWELQGNGQIKLGSSNMCLSKAVPLLVTQTLLRVQASSPARRSISHMELPLQLMVWILRIGSQSWTKQALSL